MGKRKILLGILILGVLAMVWGQSLNSGAPTASALTAGGITQSQFDQIKNAGSGGFQGWRIDNKAGLIMGWTGRTNDNFMSIGRVVGGIRGFTSIERDDELIYIQTNSYVLYLFDRGPNRGYLELQIKRL